MSAIDKYEALRLIPPVNEILDAPEILPLILVFGREYILDNSKIAIENYRKSLDAIEDTFEPPNLKTRNEVTKYIIEKLKDKIDIEQRSILRRVINATGIVLHTNLGRAPLPAKAIHLIQEVNEGYNNLEFDLEKGERGSRHSHIEPIIKRITGAESAMVVNNNAAAVFLCLNTLANNKEVVISRGQQVEIGGSFRIPDIITGSGAKMKEVGTTNKTRIDDYARAISDETALLLKVHSSNFKVTGFTQEVILKDLVELGKSKNTLVMEDLGSGCLYDLSKIGLSYEPCVQDSINDGVDIVTFSGDKLLGGPQAGIIAGKKELIDRIKRNPLTRMLRCDKTTIAALLAVLGLYMDMDNVVENIPALKMMALKEEELLEKANELKNLIEETMDFNIKTGTPGDKCKNEPDINLCKIEIVDDLDEVGGGSLPGVILNGKALAINEAKISVKEIQEALRKASIPIVCRINKDRVLLNLRTIEKKDYSQIAIELEKILSKKRYRG